VSDTANREVARMFGRIARTYDLLNRVFSLGIDRRWRAKAIRQLQLHGAMKLLDCGAGTGDMSLTAHRFDPHVETYLLDPAHEMLSLADGKAGFIRPGQFVLIRGAAERVPFCDESFDRFMVAFGIRNFADLRGGMAELHRVLKRGGCGAVLEFTPDRSRFIDRVFRWYMQKVMTPLGGKISGEAQAYAYLARTVQNFPVTDELRRMFREVGFECAEAKRLSMGIATLFILSKP
jgi:demethylmenaquinone methyltransferase/2-methoxy-6-polyprenyl-1,4-benzoquinol methylase